VLRKPLLVQQEIDGRIVKTKLLKQSKRPFVIGSSRKADMRILNDSTPGVHTALEYRHPHWYVMSMDPNSDTPETKIDKSSEIKIAGQKFKIFVGEENKKIYEDHINASKQFNAHHIVVFAGQNIVNSQYLEMNQPYGLNLGTEIKVLPAPTTGEWVVTELGKFTIRQRLTYKPEELAKPSLTLDALLDPETRNGLLIAGAFTLILLLGINLMPEKKLEEKKEDNEFVQMIFDQKVVKKLQQEAKQAQSQNFNNAPQQKIDTTPVPKQQIAQKVVKDIKNIGLSNLVAKISSRASVNALQIQAVGKTADDPNTGSALSKIGSQKVAGKVDATGSSHSIGGVKTDGKAGGSGTYSKGTGLAGAGVGTGTVDVLEEETYVDGGLDKEIIAEYIKSKLGQIRYCYERQLSGNPNLHGTVLIKFTIGGNGNVSTQSVARTTLKDANVEECILRRVAGWTFPLPKGGTSVVVSYPFLFKSIN
jgi:outer membrane biosynthesis protein TonB